MLSLALGGRAGPVEPALAGDDDPFGHVAQNWVGGPPERTPGHRAGCPLSLLPHHLAAQQETQLVLKDVDDVGREAAVRLASQVGHVHGDAAPGLQHPDTLGEHVGEHGQVLEVRRGDPVSFHLDLVVLAHEVRRRGHHESHRAVRQLVHVAGVAVEAAVA